MLTKTRKLVRGQEALAALLAEGLDMAGWIVPALHQAASGRVAVNRANAFDDAVGRHWCEFRRNPAGDSDLKPATVPI